jgi:hypothetical protein
MFRQITDTFQEYHLLYAYWTEVCLREFRTQSESGHVSAHRQITHRPSDAIYVTVAFICSVPGTADQTTNCDYQRDLTHCNTYTHSLSSASVNADWIRDIWIQNRLFTWQKARVGSGLHKNNHFHPKMQATSPYTAIAVHSLSVFALRRFALRNFAHTNLMQRNAYPLFGSSSERELAHPKSSEQNEICANENVSKGCNVAQSVKPEEVTYWVSLPYALPWCASCGRCYCFFLTILWFILLLLCFQSGNAVFHLYFFVIFRSFGNVTPNYITAGTANQGLLHSYTETTACTGPFVKIRQLLTRSRNSVPCSSSTRRLTVFTKACVWKLWATSTQYLSFQYSS